MTSKSGRNKAAKWLKLLPITILANVPVALAATYNSNTGAIHLTAAQEKTLDIQTREITTAMIRPTMTLYGQLRRNPDGIWILSSPLAGVVFNMPGNAWPRLGTKVIPGSSLVGIRPVVSTTLQITLSLELTKVKADLMAARVAQSTAVAAYKREKSLYALNKAVSLQRVQLANAAFAAARARVQADVQSIAAITQQLKTKAGGFLPLSAFHSGVITAISAHPGEAVAADQTLIKIENFHSLMAAVALPASASGRVAMGTDIRIRVLGHKHWLKAKPLTIGPEADRQTRGLAVLYMIDNPGLLRPGMAITALVPKIGKMHVMTIIPRTAVVWWRGKRWVYSESPGGMFTMRELIHPKAVPEGYAIKAGSLPANGQNIVTKGAQLLLTIKLSSTIKKSG
jgi:multidrug efflux pump subunit AcrA (membrane-fusion protein)